MRALALASLLVGLVAGCCGAGDPVPTLLMRLEGYNSPRSERYLRGEKVTARAVLENRSKAPAELVYRPFAVHDSRTGWSLHIDGGDVGPACNPAPAKLTPPSLYTLEPGGVAAVELTVGRSLGTGHYEMWVEYDPSPVLDWFLRQEGIPKTYLESNHLNFEIVEPTGVDADAWERHGDERCNRMPDDWRVQQQLADEFPDSTYVGWGLLRPTFSGCALTGGAANAQAHRPTSRRGRDASEGLQHAAAEAIGRMTDYLARRPDFAGADQMRFAIACSMVNSGDLPGARSLVNTLLEKNDLPPWLRQVTERLRHDIAQKEGAR